MQSMRDVPRKVGTCVYVVGLAQPKRVVFACPCGCGEKLTINLMRSIDPRWQLRLARGTISLRPSVWIDDDKCGSHFWIENSRVVWVDEERNRNV